MNSPTNRSFKVLWILAGIIIGYILAPTTASALDTHAVVLNNISNSLAKISTTLTKIERKLP